MTTWALLLVGALHAIAALDCLRRGDLAVATMLIGFTVADAGMVWVAIR